MPVEQTDAAVEQTGSGPVPGAEETQQAETEQKPQDESQGEAKPADEESETAEKDRPKRLGGWQRKIQKLEQELEHWREEALKAHSSSPKDAPSGPAKPTAPKLSTFQGTVEEFEKAQEEYAKKLEAYTDQLASQKAAQQRAEQAVASFQEKLQSLDDYDELDETAQAEIPHQLVPWLANECALVKNGAEVFRELIMDADYRAEFLERARLNDAAGIKGQISALAIHLRKQGKQAVTPKTVAKAPKPPTPVTKSAPTDTGLRDDLPVEEWLRRRNAQIEARKR